MVNAISPMCCLLVQVGKNEARFGLSCSSSLISSYSQSKSVLLSNKSSRIPHDVVGTFRTRGRPLRLNCGCRVRSVLAESTSKLVDNSRTEHQGEAGVATLSVAGATSLPTIHPEMGLMDSSLESTLEQRLWLGFGTSATLGMIAKAVIVAHSFADKVGIGLAAIAAYILADLGTGIYHWGIDNYGDAKTPIFGSQIDAFQGHHKRPWTITKREFANNVHATARPVGFVLLPFLILPSNPTGDLFLGLFLGLVIMSQQFHSWAHSKKSQLPAAVDFLQENGILLPRKMHGAHHRAPFSINYCIVSGSWNPILNKSKFFPWLEDAIYSRWGVAPRCWAETVTSEWLQEGSYFEDGSDIQLDREV